MFEALSPDQLAHAQGGTTCDLSGVPAAGRSIIMAESGGESTAKNPHSTAFGLGQLTIANRRAAPRLSEQNGVTRPRIARGRLSDSRRPSIGLDAAKEAAMPMDGTDRRSLANP